MEPGIQVPPPTHTHTHSFFVKKTLRSKEEESLRVVRPGWKLGRERER